MLAFRNLRRLLALVVFVMFGLSVCLTVVLGCITRRIHPD